MGLYDRDYLRDDQPRGPLAGMSMVAKLIIINAAVFVVDMLSSNGPFNHPVNDFLALSADYLRHPWTIWEFVTYGFVHDPASINHILFNMFGLWIFGREVEGRVGQREFLAFYLTAVAFSGAVWVIVEAMVPEPAGMVPRVIGASGAVTAVTILFIQFFPRRQILLFFVLPMQAWVAGVLFVLLDLGGAFRNEGRVAYVVHLGGAAFALLYFRLGWQLDRFAWLDTLKLRWRRTVGPGRNLRVHDSGDDEQDTQQRLDEILAKISAQGESSLTREERHFLTETSRRYQRRRQ